MALCGSRSRNQDGPDATTATLLGGSVCLTSRGFCSSVDSHNLKMWEAVEGCPTPGDHSKENWEVRLASVLACRRPSTVCTVSRLLLSFHSLGMYSQSYGFSSSPMYGCESWTLKKAEHQRIDAFELWCWRRLLRVPWTARRSNQCILKEISPGISLEGLMLKLKLQYSGHLMQRVD